MRKLILMRHAKAEGASASGEDFDRALTQGGRADAALMGRVLAEAGAAPALALVSDARRTRETWQGVAQSFPEAAVRHERRLYNASAAAIRSVVEAAGGDADTLIVVGHNPGLPLYMLELLTEAAESASVMDKARGSFPPASAVVFEFDEHLRPTFSNLYLARDHGGGGRE